MCLCNYCNNQQFLLPRTFTNTIILGSHSEAPSAGLLGAQPAETTRLRRTKGVDLNAEDFSPGQGRIGDSFLILNLNAC